MELLLNLLWLLLVVPAFWVWRRQDRNLESLRCLLVLGCGIVLLFPVISASDDLQAMRPEMEESSPLKRALQQGTIAKAFAQDHPPKAPAALTLVFVFRPCCRFWAQSPVEPVSTRMGLRTEVLPTRAPPIFILA
jgi:hypothetical protein